jgi:hypothetical protein
MRATQRNSGGEGVGLGCVGGAGNRFVGILSAAEVHTSARQLCTRAQS